MATMGEFMPLDTQEEKSLSLKKKAKKLRARQLKEKRISVSSSSSSAARGGGRSSVVYVGRIPHGFYEEQMRGFFSQFGNIKHLRVSRNKKTGKSKHFAFIQFESPEVAEIVADSMNNYLLYEHLLQVKVVPLERVHNRMWVGAGRVYKPPNWKWLENIRQNREKRPEEQKEALKRILRRENKRKTKIKAAGIDYEYPDLRSSLPVVSKKIKFSEEDVDEE